MNPIHNLSISYRRAQTILFRKIIKLSGSKIIILTGCGRSGTTFSSKLLRSCGIYIGHERLYINGISSWYILSDQNKVLVGPSYNDLKDLDATIIHQVREPIAAISSMLSIGNLSWQFLAQELPIDLDNDSKVLMAMKYYYYWNLKAENKCLFRVRAENFISDIAPILKSLGVKLKTANININSNDKINTRKHVLLTWDDLNRECKPLCNNIKIMGIRYGFLND